MAVSWRDALKTGKPAAAAAPVPPDPASVSPTLAALLDERTRMEAQMAALTGAGAVGADDPRYAVAPMAVRRADFARWAQARDDGRPVAAPVAPVRAKPPEATRPLADRTAPDRSVAGRMMQALGAARADPPVRATPGETPGGTPGAADAFAAIRDAARAVGRGDASGLIDKTFDRVVTGFRPLRGEDALARAKRAIPDDWRERARRAIPQLGDDGHYAQRAKKLLEVAVGNADQLAAKAEQMRDMARDVRELREADEANDDKRRDRALERLKAKRQEDA